MVQLEMSDDTITPGFERDIRPLFRELDRESMASSFDLWALEDVKANAQGILDRLDDGTMPCDGSWPQEHVDIFRRWVDAGSPP
jgi:hypothetical protein